MDGDGAPFWPVKLSTGLTFSQKWLQAGQRGELTRAQQRWTLAVQSGREVLYGPTPKGAEFHDLTIANAILEGPRGTGKSVILRNDAHMHAMSCPGLAYLIVRRTMPELRKSHLRFVDAEMHRLGGRFNKTESIAYYSNGSLGFYGHCEGDADVMIYLSSQFARLYIDEITTFPGEMILKLASTVRVPEDSGWLAAMRGGTNPLGESAEFVKRWFIDKNVPLDESDEYDPSDYTAIRMARADNPFMDWKQYDKRLASLPEHVRRAWMHGEWVIEGAYFSDFCPFKNEQPWHVIDALPMVRGAGIIGQPYIGIYRALDFGFDPDPAVCLWIAVLPNGRAIVFKEKTWHRTTAAEVAKAIVRESEGMKIVESFCDPTMFMHAKALGTSVGDVFEINGVPLTPSVSDRTTAGLAIHEYLNTVIDEQPKLQMLRPGSSAAPGCPWLIRTIPDIKMDPSDPKRIGDGNDHYVMALAYFCMSNAVPTMEVTGRVKRPWMHPRHGTTGYRIGSGNTRENHA